MEEIVTYLKRNSERLRLSNDYIYQEFPIYKDLDQKAVIVPVATISIDHGIVVFLTALDRVERDLYSSIEQQYRETLDEIYRLLFSKFVKNPALSKGRNSISVPITTVLYAPNVPGGERVEKDDLEIVFSEPQIDALLSEISQRDGLPLSTSVLSETVATIEGAKGLLVPRKREATDTKTKGYVANLLEKEICQFDIEQKNANLTDITGISRIRGLAGSGKTVILCMKAAILHLKYPDAVIVFTFYTRSLYQHVRRLITRFYRQFDDCDPNWDNLLVMHAWGSNTQSGVYRTACERYGIPPLSYEATLGKGKQAFDFACNDFLDKKADGLPPIFDYMLIDEGQDFPPSFLKICASIVKEERFVYAYDDLQTIFQRKAPDAKAVFGVDEKGRAKHSFAYDKILYKCYRNPLPIIVTAHAVGFGIYADNIVQMIERSYWEDIGYVIEKGDCNAGDDMVITRPKKNSQTTLVDRYSVDDLVQAEVFERFNEEIDFVCARIDKDIHEESLHPDDILVVSVDDRNASTYFNVIERVLNERYGISSNNIHADKFSVSDFQQEGKVTLSTIHKAKGNEAYSVYVVGMDALFPFSKNVRERNILFTAMTRSKGWLTLTGIGDTASRWKSEIDTAKTYCPSLRFKYPTEKELDIMTRDMDEAAVLADRREKLTEDLLKTMDVEQAIIYLEQKRKKKEE